MPVERLKVTNVGPFDDIEFEFDRHVNVFTGSNNSGKSTALWALGDAIVYPFAFPPKLIRRDATPEFSINLSGDSSRVFHGQLPIAQNTTGYWTQERWTDFISILKDVGYTGFIPALRQSTDFRSRGPTVSTNQTHEKSLDSERLTVVSRSGNFEAAHEQAHNLLHGGVRVLGDEERKRLRLISSNALWVSDEEVIQKIIDLDYRSYRRDEPTVRNIISQIGGMASQITEGFPIEFQRVEEDERGLFPQFRTPDGDLPLNVLSQGTQSIIQWLAHLLIGYAEYYDYPSDLAEYPAIVIIDEIDAHLHPSWQRGVIPTLIGHFPNLQLFCSTHSPLMLAGLKEEQVQLLSRDHQTGKVTVTRNNSAINGWSADEILRGFLHVPEPTDLQTVSHLERLRRLREKQDLSEDESAEIEVLRHTVSRELMAGPRSAQVEEFAELLRRAREGATTSDEQCIG